MQELITPRSTLYDSIYLLTITFFVKKTPIVYNNNNDSGYPQNSTINLALQIKRIRSTKIHSYSLLSMINVLRAFINNCY